MHKVKIEISSNRIDEPPIEVVYFGSMEEKEENALIRYSESELTGMEGVFTELLIRGDHLEIVRTGKVEARMVFKEKVQDRVLYAMEMGTLNMVLKTDKLHIHRTGGGYAIEIRYQLEIGGNPPEGNDMKIRITRN